MTRPVVAIHGISEKRNAAGFSSALKRIVAETARRHNHHNPDQVGIPLWSECVWSDLSDLPDRPVLAPLDLFLDVYRYDKEPTLRSDIATRLRAMLTPDTAVVAHSLGTIVVIEEMIRAASIGDERPFAALLTIGSPAGLRLDLSIDALGVELDIDWRRHGMTLTDYAETLKSWGLCWLDVWCPGDIVHTGHVPVPVFGGPYGTEGLERHYPTSSLKIDGGNHPVSAHLHYWRNPIVAGLVLDLATGDK